MAFDQFLGKGAGIAEVAGLTETFISEPANVEVRLIAADEFVISNYSFIP